MSTLSQFGGGVKSVQRGTITISTLSNTATITSVDTAKSICSFLGAMTDATDGPSAFPYIALTNSTTVTATRKAQTAPTYVSYEVVEFY